MKISRLLEIINEFGGSYDRSGFASRPDDSGIRSKGAKRDPVGRMSNFPYDRDVFYGQPNAYDRGSSGGASLHGPLVPKDDSKFSLRILGQDEALGSPMHFGISSSPGLGTSTTVPGVAGWANDPPKKWDDDDVDEGPLTIDTRVPPTEEVPNFSAPDFRMQTDDDLENRLDRIWGQEDNMNFVDPSLFGQPDSHIIAPDPWSVVNARLSSRGLYGLMPKESAWDRISGMVLVKREIS